MQKMESLMTIGILATLFSLMAVSGLVSILKQLIDAFCNPESH